MFSSSYGIGVGGTGIFDYLISQNLESVNCQYHTYYGKFSELSADGGSEKQKLVCGTPDAPRTQNIGVRHIEAWTVPAPRAYNTEDNPILTPDEIDWLKGQMGGVHLEVGWVQPTSPPAARV